MLKIKQIPVAVEVLEEYKKECEAQKENASIMGVDSGKWDNRLACVKEVLCALRSKLTKYQNLKT